MSYTERKRRSSLSVILLFCFALAGMLTGSTPVSSSAHAEAMTASVNLTSITPMSTGTEKSYVYDASENKLMYNRITGMVFSEIGVVYNQDSQPLIYDDKTEQFEDSLQRRLDLVER